MEPSHKSIVKLQHFFSFVRWDLHQVFIALLLICITAEKSLTVDQPGFSAITALCNSKLL